jgi:uncharacterized protein (DUF1499 family)
MGVFAVDPNFEACPDSPNCVSTEADRSDAEHFIERIPFSGSAEDAFAKMLQILEDLPRTKIVFAEDGRIKAEVRSLVFRFVDDVEIFIDVEASNIAFRSASRTGYSDIGVNRKRYESIRESFLAGN